MRPERLILRPLEEGDLDILHRLYGDAEVMHYTPFDPESLRQSQAHLARVIEDWGKTPLLSREYVIAVRDGEQKIGRCHILLEDDAGGRAMIGWMLVQEAWGKGYATETAQALIA